MRAEGSQERLADRVSVKMRQGGQLATSYGARNVRMNLDGPLRPVWERGHVSVGELWGYYARYPYLTRLRDRRVLEEALRAGVDDMMWESEGFALASSYDEGAGSDGSGARSDGSGGGAVGWYEGLACYLGGSVGPITDSTLVVRPERAKAQLLRVVSPGPEPSPTSSPGPQPPIIGPGPGPEPPRPPPPPPVPAPPHRRFFGVAKLNPERYGRDFTRIATEVVEHLTAVDGTHLEVTLEISATNDGGFPDDKVRIITENARTLKFDQLGFEGE